MGKYESQKDRIIELKNQGLGRDKIADIIKQETGDELAPRKISYYLKKWGFKYDKAGNVIEESSFSELLEDNGLPTNWTYGWIKSKDASVFVKNAGLSLEAIRDGYVDAVKEAIGDIKWPKPPKQTQSGNLFVPCIFDLHLGKLAWGEETGEDYDYKIAVKRFRVALEDLIAKAEGYSVERILFPVGNDIYNSDKAKPFPQTTNGTPQMDDLRWQKLFRTGVQLITEAIIRLSKIAPVDVKMVYSNHDHERVFYLGETLSAVFDSHAGVDVDNNPKVRKYYRWGEVLIGLAHGHNEKPTDLPLIMAQESKEAWGDTFYREWLLGHLHHRSKFLTQESKDYRGVNVRYITSPSAADAWHAERAFVGAIKGAEGFIYNQEEGLVGSVIHNIK